MVKTQNSEIKKDIKVAQFDWDGTLINSFRIEEEIIGGFYIDEAGKRMFAVAHGADDSGNELFEVVSYLL